MPRPPWPNAWARCTTGWVDVIRSYTPEVVAVEDIFYAKNVRSAAVLGHVRGVALLAADMAGLEVFEYAPAQTKVAVAGYGRADKAQVALMVKQILGIRGNLQPDASDALAVAICHLNQTQALKGMTRRGKKMIARLQGTLEEKNRVRGGNHGRRRGI